MVALGDKGEEEKLVVFVDRKERVIILVDRVRLDLMVVRKRDVGYNNILTHEEHQLLTPLTPSSLHSWPWITHSQWRR